MPVLVQKFGGSSVSTHESRQIAIHRVLEARAQGYDVVVVVSAMGRLGAPYATDTLLDLISRSGQLAKRDLDLVMSCGEIISAGVFLAELQQHCPAAMLTGRQAGILTDTFHGDARITHVDPKRVRELLASGRVVIVTGFQGVSADGEITTLGRGGSDTSAVALGVALGAEAVVIYTDVDGIMTADPKLVPEAKVLPAVDYQEMLQMAYEGAKVLHSRAVEMAMHNNLPLIVRSLTGEHPGTLITTATSYEARRSYPVVGVAHKVGLAQVSLQPDGKDPRFDCRLFVGLAEQGVSVDLINVSPKTKMFVVDAAEIEPVENVLQQNAASYDIRPGCCKVSVVGIGMRGIPGIMATLCRALREADVEILQTSDSHMTISCLIDEQQLGAAVRSLHHHFRLTQLG
ncbi:MAG: aspartate kinase [Firmicutes bacterium]|nr:aspartate kinase [Bacillota bacterium]